MHSTFRLAAVLAGCGLLAGCGRQPANQTANQSTAVPASTIGLSSSQITDDEVLAFTQRFSDVIASGDFDAASDVFDWNTLTKRALEGVNLPPQERASIMRGLLQSLRKRSSLIANIHHQVAEGGSYQLMKIHEIEGQPRALFRLLGVSGGVNHHDVVLAKSMDGRCRAIDMYIYVSGEFTSTTMKRTLLRLLADQHRSLIGRLTGQDRLLVKHAADLQNMAAALQTNPRESLRIFHTLPLELQCDKSTLLARFTAAQTVGDEQEYLQTLADFRRVYPQDACIELLSIDYFIARREYEKALQAVDSANHAVGGDSMFDVMKANVLSEFNRLDEARALALAAIDTEPTLFPAWLALVKVDLKAKDYEQTLEHLKEIDEQFEIEWNDLSQEPDYAEFAASPQYQQWLDYRAADTP